eukprot:164242_1
MPSFGVDNFHPFNVYDTYRRYLPISLHFGRAASYDLDHPSIKTTCKATSIFLTSFVLISCIAMTWSFVLEYLLYHQYTIYDIYYLYYINYGCIISARLSLLFLWAHMFPIVSNTKHSTLLKCKKYCLPFILSTTSISIGIFLMHLWYTASLYINHKTSSTLCSYVINCTLADPLSFYALFIQFILIFLMMITFCVRRSQFDAFRRRFNIRSTLSDNKKHRKQPSRKRGDRDPRGKTAILLANHENDGFNPPKPEAIDVTHDQDDEYELDFDENDELQSPMAFKAMKYRLLKLQIASFGVFCLLWIVRYVFSIWSVSFVHKYCLYIYAILVVVMSLLKKILKYIARKLDGLRTGNPTMSFEYLCEFYCCGVYWILWRQFMLYKVILDEDYLSKCIVMLSIHVMIEMYSFLLRSSDWYFDNTNDWLHDLQQRQHRVYIWFHSRLNDECTVYQWRTRLAFDLGARMNVCIVTAVIQQIYLLLRVPSIYSTYALHADDGFEDSVFVKAIICNVSVVCVELLVYLISMILIYRWHWLNVWELFDNMVSSTMGRKFIIFYWVVCIVSLH